MLQMEIPAAVSLNSLPREWMSAFVTVMAAGRTLRDAFFPVCSPALLEGMHPLRGPEDLKHHTLIHDRSRYPR